jgi:hypothetical protein
MATTVGGTLRPASLALWLRPNTSEPSR